MFGLKPPSAGLPRMPQMPRPAINLPGLRRGSLPGLQRSATMPNLGAPKANYDDLVRLGVMQGLKRK